MLLAGWRVTFGQGGLSPFSAQPCESLPRDPGDGASTLGLPMSLSPPAPRSWVCAGRPVLPAYPSES